MEFYFIKQLPICICFTLSNSNSERKEDTILITYLEYNNNNNLKLFGVPLDSSNILFAPRKNIITIRCGLGKTFIDKKTCKATSYPSTIGNSFSIGDMTNLINSIKNQDKTEIFTLYKNGVTIVIRKNQKDNSFSLVKVILGVKINPGNSKSVLTPINIITELNNNRNGLSKLIDNKKL